MLPPAVSMTRFQPDGFSSRLFVGAWAASTLSMSNRRRSRVRQSRSRSSKVSAAVRVPKGIPARSRFSHGFSAHALSPKRRSSASPPEDAPRPIWPSQPPDP